MKTVITQFTESNFIEKSGNRLLSRLLLFFMVFFAGMQLMAQNTYTSTNAGNWNVAANWNRVGPGPGTTPGADSGDIVIINHAMTLNVNPANPLGSLTVNSGVGSLNLSVGVLTVNGPTLVDGTLSDNSNTGSTVFNGTFTVSASGSFSTANSSAFTFNGDIVNNGTFSKTGTGNISFGGNLSISGANTLTMAGVATVGNGFTVSNTATVNLSYPLNGANAASTWLNDNGAVLNYSNASQPMATGVLDASIAGNTVNYNGAGQTIKPATYQTLLISGSGTKTLGGNTIVNAPLTVPATFTLQLSSFDFTANSTLTVNGTLNDNNNSGTNIFNGDIIINAGAAFSNVGSSPFKFGGNITNNGGTFNKTGSGAVEFTANSTLSGIGSFAFNGTTTIKDNIIVTNQTTTTFSGILNGANAGSTFINDVNSTLNYNNVAQLMASGVLNASASGNTVNYNGGSQTVKQGTYFHIGFAGTGVKTFSSDVVILGDFTRTAGTMVFSTGQTTTFSGGSNANLTASNFSFSFKDLIVDKSGGSLTFVPGGTITTSATSLTITAGSLKLGATNTTLTISGDLSGSGTLDMSGADHMVNLLGENNSIGTLTSNPTPSTGTISYNRGSDQNIFGSPNYRNLVINGANNRVVTLNGNVAVSGNLDFQKNVKVLMGANDIKIKASGKLISNAAFSVNRMFITDGAGVLVKEGTTLATFTADMYGTGLYPVGNSGGLYTPFEITSLSATITPTASISVRAVPTRQPNIPYYNNALNKFWDVETANISGITADLRFTYHVSELIGQALLYTPRLWNGSILSTPAGSAASSPFTLTGMTNIAGQWSAADPTMRAILYSYQSGDWANANTWTTDPSGSTLVSPMVPGVGDQVVILNGRTVTTAVSRTIGQLEIQAGGTLDIGSTTGHDFGVVSGEGLLRLSSGTFPSGTYTVFTSSSGGTVEYYNLPATTSLSGQATYNNLVFSNNTATSYTAMPSVSLLISGNLTLSKSAAGTTTFSLPNAGPLTVTINKNVTIGAGCTWNIDAAATQQHSVTIKGNLSNNGTLDFQNGTAYSASSGRAVLTFMGTTINTTATFNAGSFTEFFQVVMTKNDGYELYMSSSSSATVNFYGSAPAINPTLGTLRLGPNLNVPNLNPAGGNYDLGAPGKYPVFWIDGATVTFGTSGGAIVPYGTLKITAGTLNVLTGQQAVVIRESGLLQIDGGTVNMGIFRTSTTTTTHRGSFVMTGGTLNLSGVASTEAQWYAIFSLPYQENVFKMSGGTINITRTGGGSITPSGGIMIASATRNYDVTGGQINIKSTGNINFDISSTAPFYNLNIGRQTAGTGTVRLNAIDWSYDGGIGNKATVPAQPLTVLNNLIIETANSPVFNALGNNINAFGNFSVNSGATLTTGANIVKFAGNSAQAFTVDGTISAPGMGSITVDKGAASTLTLAGTVSNINATGNLRLLTGVLNTNGKVLNVAGDIENNATHSGTGKISLNGSVAQTISGNGNGQFENLEVSVTNGVSVTATANLNINGNLNFASDRILNISIYKLKIAAAATITSSAGSFGPNRFIATDGYQSDGGIVKTYNSTAPFLFPFGTGSNYTPATIQFSATPGTWGTLNVRPVKAKQLYVTDPDVFEYYWKVGATGFSGIPAGSINHTFNYGNLPDNTSYIPGYYNYQSIAYTSINDVSKVDEASNNIYFTGVSYYIGDFTAGVPAAFGVVVPYYSRTNGNWNTPSTWSNTGHSGSPSLTIPTANTPVFIGDGVSFFHTVTVTNNNTYSGSLIVDAGSTLDLTTTTGNNFGALPYSTAGGAGTLKISSAVTTAEFPAGDFGIFFTQDGGTTEYYTTGGQTFTLPKQTAAPTSAQIRTYRNLNLTPIGAGAIIMPERNIEVFENMAIGGGGVARLNDASSKTLTIDGNLNINFGTLRFMNNSSQLMYVKGNTNVSNNGTLDVDNTGSIAHSLKLEGNLTNNGNIQFNQASDVNLFFIGNQSKVFNGSNALAVSSLNQLNIDKGTNKSLSVELNVAGTLNAPTNNWLNLINGTFIFNKAATITLNDQAVSSFLIPATTGFAINNAGAVVNASYVNSNSADMILAGKLQISAGTMNVGPLGSPNHNDLEYAATDIPELIIEGNGVLNVNGQIRRSVNVLLGSLSYTQKDNSTVLVRGVNPEVSGSFNHNRGKFEVLNAGSSFTMKDNALLVIDRTGAPNGIVFGDFYLDPQYSNVTGGEIRIGTGNTPANMTFTVNSTVALWDFSVDGTTTTKFARLLNNPLTVQRNLRIDGNSAFVAAGYDVTIGGNLINNNPANTKGIPSTMYGGYRSGTSAAEIAAQVTTLNGSVTQTISGVSGNLTNFGNLVINNTSAGGVNLAGNTNIAVIGTLNLINGNINGGANNITADGNIENNVSVSNTGAGYFICGSPTSSIQTLSGNGSGSFANFQVRNSAGINMVTPFTINGDMKFVNGLFYINNHLLTFGLNATVSGSLSSASMIRLNGVTSDAGVKKLYPAGPQLFTFPVGVTMKYTPATIDVKTNVTAGTVTLKPVGVKHPATTDVADKELTYYWNTTSTGFDAATITKHVYAYQNSDAINGNENFYVTGRYINNVWTPQFGIPSTVNSITHTITLDNVNYIDGDYTAGESSEFDQLLVFYSRNATSGGNWNNPASWSTDPVLQHAGPAAAVAPSFNSVVIAAGHTITVTASGMNAPTTTLNGTLNIGDFSGHNFGTVTGTGKLLFTTAISNHTYVFPGGNFSAFVNAGGGSVEYQSNVFEVKLPTQATYNNLILSGSKYKFLPNNDLIINGNIELTGGITLNDASRIINLKGNFVNLAGVSGLNHATGNLILSGGSQSITGATQFYNLTVNGSGVKTLNTSIDVSNELSLVSGIVTTGLNQLSIQVSATVTGGSASSYVNGNLRKYIAANTISKTFEIGDNSRYAPVSLSFAGNTNAAGSILASTTAGDHSNIGTSLLDANKSVNRYWSLFNSGVTGFTSYSAVFNFNAADLDGGAVYSNLDVARYASGTWSLPTVGTRSAISTQATGLNAFGDFIVAEKYLGGLTWNGSINEDWNLAGNWTPNFVPGSGDNITIAMGAHQPSFLTGGNGNCKDITFNAGTSLTVPSGFVLNVSGNWTGANTEVNGSGTVKFTSSGAQHSGFTTFKGVLSVASGANLNTGDGITMASGANLMHGAGTTGGGGNITGQVKVQRQGANGYNYNYWSSPITNADINLLKLNRFRYNPVSATGIDIQGLKPGWIPTNSGTMTVGRGYIATSSGLVSFSGNVNNANLSYGPLVLGTYTQFNLIGNPYPSNISAAALVAANPQISGGAIYLWDDDGSVGTDYDFNDYITWNGIGQVGPNSGTPFNGNIAVGQGFFVKASNTNPVQFTNSMRTSGQANFFESSPVERLWVSVTTAQNDYNEILIGFKPDATDAVDNAYDAQKLSANEKISMYSMIEEGKYAIQALSSLTTDKIVQVGIDASVNGPQTFRLNKTDNLDETVQIILEDTKKGVFHNLRSNPVYQYDFDKSADVKRFRLHFKPGVEIQTSTESCVQNDGVITIKTPSSTSCQVTVRNQAGDLVTEKTNVTGFLTIPGLSAGEYLVKMVNNFGMFIQKEVEIKGGTPVRAAISADALSVEASKDFVGFKAEVNGTWNDLTWNFGDGTIITGELRPVHMFTEPGVYTVSFIASNANCMDMKEMQITVKGNATGIVEVDKSAFSVYPNPVTSGSTTVRMNLKEKNTEVTLYLVDAAGRIVRTEKLSSTEGLMQTQLQTGDLANGVYQLLISGKNFSAASKITIAK